MNLFHILSNLEADDNYHLGRLLVLLNAFAGKRNNGTVGGLTKLAKLDFLLRYPVFLERALQAKKQSTRKVEVTKHERTNVESSMVRYKYGPWDFRYRRFINLLVGMGLVTIQTKGRTIEIRLTQAGYEASAKLSEDDAFQDLARRAGILKTHFNVKGSTLMKFIYDTFPEIASLRLGEEINA